MNEKNWKKWWNWRCIEEIDKKNREIHKNRKHMMLNSLKLIKNQIIIIYLIKLYNIRERKKWWYRIKVMKDQIYKNEYYIIK